MFPDIHVVILSAAKDLKIPLRLKQFLRFAQNDEREAQNNKYTKVDARVATLLGMTFLY